MNRERVLQGKNSYEKDLKFPVLDFLEKRLQDKQEVSWLDLCCGSGKALIEAAVRLQTSPFVAGVRLVGVDLVGMFAPVGSFLPLPELRIQPVDSFVPTGFFDLITCVHGLHYLGDKLRTLERAASWLASDGIFLAHLDVNNFRIEGHPQAEKLLRAEFRKQEITFSSQTHILQIAGGNQISFPFSYLGADDRSGPNYTGQPAVTSVYSVEF
ncbi:MAG: class I SAM-dependent methyltransferase [Blastocatellia bacterium]|nr:class I SAM-dependent methyltransferase [Blastocatellia bacterium]